MAHDPLFSIYALVPLVIDCFINSSSARAIPLLIANSGSSGNALSPNI